MREANILCNLYLLLSAKERKRLSASVGRVKGEHEFDAIALLFFPSFFSRFSAAAAALRVPLSSPPTVGPLMREKVRKCVSACVRASMRKAYSAAQASAYSYFAASPPAAVRIKAAIAEKSASLQTSQPIHSIGTPWSLNMLSEQFDFIDSERNSAVAINSFSARQSIPLAPPKNNGSHGKTSVECAAAKQTAVFLCIANSFAFNDRNSRRDQIHFC